jgi:hypothetical protein
MRSASRLLRYCAYPEVLSTIPPRTAPERLREANKRAAADRGKIFHTGVETWAATGTIPVVEDLEIQGWLDLLASQWKPPVGLITEMAWGLSHDGEHLEVTEPEPHVYVASNGSSLLTAGRLDAGWTQGISVPTNGPHIAFCGDWKSGRFPVTPAYRNLQANAGGIALAKKLGAAGYVPGIYYCRDGYWDWGEPVMLGSPEHRNIFAEIKAAALLDSGTPVPGEHCATCWERKKCAHSFEGGNP